MKKLKKYLILCSFLFFFFLPKINASDGLVNDYYTEFNYSSDLLTAKQTYQTKIDTLIEAIDNNPQQFFGNDIVDIGSDIISINKDDLANDVMAFKTGKFLNGYNSIYNYGTTATFCMSVRNWTYNFNTGNFSGSTSGYRCYDVSSIEATPTNNQIAYLNDYFYVDNYLNNQNTYKNMLFEFVNGDVNHPLKVGNIIHLTSGNIAVSDFFNSFIPSSSSLCTKVKPLGVLSLVSEFDVVFEGKSNALDYPIEGDLTISYNANSILSDTDFDITFNDYDSFIDGSYSLVCSSTSQFCNLHFSYSYQDDIDENIKFGFNIKTISGVTMPYFIRLYVCLAHDNYDTNITYTYTDAPPSSNNTDSILNNFLQDGSLPNVNGLVDTSILPAGPIDSILLLPLSIMQSLLNVLNSSTCQPLQLPIPFVNGTLTLPCISTIYSQINGLNVFLNWFSAIFSAFLLYKYFIYLYKWVDDTLTFRENNHFGGY